MTMNPNFDHLHIIRYSTSLPLLVRISCKASVMCIFLVDEHTHCTGPGIVIKRRIENQF